MEDYTFRPVTNNYGKEGCSLPAVGPLQFVCGETVLVTFCAEDICGNVGTLTGSISIFPQNFSVPENAGTTVACAVQAVPPTLPIVLDNCDNPITPTGPILDGSFLDCEGIITFTYTYTDCAGVTYPWVYTYTISAPVVTMPAGGASTVACVANATLPTPPAVIDNCSRPLSVSAGVPGCGSCLCRN